VSPRIKAIDARRTRETPFDFEAVFHLHYERIARVIARIVRDPARAEELAVEVFWKLWRTPRAQGEHAGGWLYRAAVRAGLYELRRQLRRARYERLLRFLPGVSTPEEVHAAAEEQQHVRLVLAALDPRQAELLLLRGHGLSYNEVASALQLKPASVGTLLGRAKKAFRKEYLEHYGEQRNQR